jgi:hypothetical protein
LFYAKNPEFEANVLVNDAAGFLDSTILTSYEPIGGEVYFNFAFSLGKGTYLRKGDILNIELFPLSILIL